MAGDEDLSRARDEIERAGNKVDNQTKVSLDEVRAELDELADPQPDEDDEDRDERLETLSSNLGDLADDQEPDSSVRVHLENAQGHVETHRDNNVYD